MDYTYQRNNEKVNYIFTIANGFFFINRKYKLNTHKPTFLCKR